MNANVASSLSTGTLAPDRKTQYFKITIWSIVLLVSSVFCQECGLQKGRSRWV